MAMEDEIDITDALASVLKEKLEFTGAISFHRAYADAPNPCIELSKLGSVGLPLNPREAKAIKTRAQRVFFDAGKRTVVDTSERDTWKMDADKVVLRNPAWKVWLECIVQEVCKTLGVDYGAIQPRCELDKLLLYETGSHFLPHVDTRKADNMFATILVVLPSTFTGGAAHVSHGGQSVVYDCSKTSDVQTSVMAWYTDVMHEVEPITSGYRLALSYSLLHTTKALRPALSNGDNVLNAFRQVLLAWRAGAGSDVPDKILYLLEHSYSPDNLNRSALKGTDAQRTAILDALGKELGFSLGLASLECYIKGIPEDVGSGYRRDFSRNDREFDDDDDVLKFGRIKQRSMSLTNFVGCDGEEIADKIEIEGRTKTIPDNLEQAVTSRLHDKELECRRYFGDPGILERWYRRTLLVIWPNFTNYLVTRDLDGVCADLRAEADESDEATPEQRATIEFLLARTVDSCGDAVTVANAVCHATCRWHDLELWRRVVNKCSCAAGVATLGAVNICIAMKTFGFETVRSSLETMIRHEQSNKHLFTFLVEFRAFNWEEFEEESDDDEGEGDELAAVVLKWIDAQRAASLKTLRTVSKDDFPILSQLAVDYGGLTFVRDSILPQLVRQKDAFILREYAVYTAQEQNITDTTFKHDVVSQILKASISELIITLPRVRSLLGGYPYRPPPNPTKPDQSFEVVKSYFETCIALNCLDQAGDVIEKVADITGQSVEEAQRRANRLMLPFLTWVAQFLAQQPNEMKVPKLAMLQKIAIPPMLEDTRTNDRRRGITRGEVGQLLQIASLPGGMDIFVTNILPELSTLASSEASSKAILDEFEPQLTQLVLPASYKGPGLSEIITSVAKKYAQFASLTTTNAVIGAMDRCIRMQALDGVWDILDRVLELKKLNEPFDKSYNPYAYGVPQRITYADKVVLPLVAQLRQLALKYNMLTALAPAFRQIARTYTQKVLGHIPSADPEKRLSRIRRWTCSCVQCADVRKFLLTTPERSISLPQIGTQKWEHVETYLNQHVTSEGATWGVIAACALSPHGMRVTKTDLLFNRSVWEANQKKAIQLVKDASPDEQERMRIYGDEYAEFARWITGIPTPGVVTSAGSSNGAACISSASLAAPIPAVGLKRQRAVAFAGPSTNSANRPAATTRVRRASNTRSIPTLPAAKRAKTSSRPLDGIAVIDLTES